MSAKISVVMMSLQAPHAVGAELRDTSLRECKGPASGFQTETILGSP